MCYPRDMERQKTPIPCRPRRFKRTGRAALAAALAALAAFATGHAAAGQYANSRSPYWTVGSLNQVLSDACQKREFNQIEPFRLTLGFIGPAGMAITGIAKMGWNLNDPRGLAQSGFTYHFFNDGLSNCQVYLAGSRLTR